MHSFGAAFARDRGSAAIRPPVDNAKPLAGQVISVVARRLLRSSATARSTNTACPAHPTMKCAPRTAGSGRTTGRSPTGSSAPPPTRIAQKREEAERAFHRVGITFAVYGEESGTERLIPFDIVPRIIPGRRMGRCSSAACSSACRRSTRSSHDIYHDQEILKAGVDPGRARARQRAVPRARCRASTCRAASTRTSPASTSCAPARASSTCSRTTCACPRACRTCSRTAR